MGDDQIKIPTGRFDDIHDREQYIQAAIKSIVVLNNKFTETNNNINELGKKYKIHSRRDCSFQTSCLRND